MPTLQTGTIAAIRLTETTTPATPAAGSYKIYVKSDGIMYLIDDAGNEVPFSTGVTSINDYIQVCEQQTTGTAGGTFTQGSWVTRVINTEVSDSGGHCSISSNQITLVAGTYTYRISAPAFYCNSNQARLQNITDAATEAVGTLEISDNALGNGVMSHSVIVGKMTLAASKTFEVQHQCQTTRNTNGLGVASVFSVPEIYTVAEFWRIA
jgi:hypothetical protein